MNKTVPIPDYRDSALRCDLYQITMAYGYWKARKHNDIAVFDVIFRENPFKGEFTVFAGLKDALEYVRNFKFTKNDILFIKKNITSMKNCENEFFDWLLSIDTSEIKIYSVPEGTIVFPRVPVMIFEGPVAVCQLLESAVLNTLNFASLITTKSARIRLLAKDKTLLEFGLRRAQGPDGALSASRYSYLGGFDATSNVLAGKLFNIPISGTHAHSFVSSFTSLLEVTNTLIKSPDKKKYDLKKLALKYRKELGYENSNEGELASFLSYAISFPKSFLALVDTYDTINSGIPNFLCIALSLLESGYKPVGIRLDSGDLAYLSKKAREIFNKVSKKYSIDLSYLKITASNDIDEDIIESLNLQKHEIDIFGIGTKLATCYQQPALGYVYKLVMLNNIPRIKISQNINKITIPGKKKVFRIWTNQSCPFADLIMSEHEKTPKINEKILLRHPFFENKRILIKPSKIIPLYKTVFDKGKMLNPEKTEKIRSYIKEQIGSMREDHLRRDNPARYKVSVSQDLYEFMQELLAKESPVEEIN